MSYKIRVFRYTFGDGRVQYVPYVDKLRKLWVFPIKERFAVRGKNEHSEYGYLCSSELFESNKFDTYQKAYDCAKSVIDNLVKQEQANKVTIEEVTK